jgi:hypothetical protein
MASYGSMTRVATANGVSISRYRRIFRVRVVSESRSRVVFAGLRCHDESKTCAQGGEGRRQRGKGNGR